MEIRNISTLSFKAYVPAIYMAKNPKNDEYVPVIKKENIRKCNSQIVRSLNKTIKNPNSQIIEKFKEADNDYKKGPYVRSFYDKAPTIYLVTGNDAQALDEEGREIGIAQSESIEAIGTTNTFEVKYAKRSYAEKMKCYIKRVFKRIRSNEGKNQTFVAYFEPQYKKTGELKGFKYVDSEFKNEDEIIFKKSWIKKIKEENNKNYPE